MAEEDRARERVASMPLEDVSLDVDVLGMARTTVRRDQYNVVGEGPGYFTRRGLPGQSGSQLGQDQLGYVAGTDTTNDECKFARWKVQQLQQHRLQQARRQGLRREQQLRSMGG